MLVAKHQCLVLQQGAVDLGDDAVVEVGPEVDAEDPAPIRPPTADVEADSGRCHDVLLNRGDGHT
jgi:hypothetical protein